MTKKLNCVSLENGHHLLYNVSLDNHFGLRIWCMLATLWINYSCLW